MSDFDNEIADSKVPIAATAVAAKVMPQHFANSISKIALYQEGKSDNLNKLYPFYRDSKLTQVVRQNKRMMMIISKLHINPRGFHNPLSSSEAIYTTILICEYIYRT